MSKELNNLLTLFKQKKYLIAEKKCSELIKKIKPNYEIFNIYAVILYEIKKYDKAIEYWNKAIELNPQYYFGYNNLGNVYLKTDKYKEAINCYDKAIQIKSDYYEAYFNKGNVYVKKDDYVKAINCFDKAIQIKNDYLPALKSRNEIFVTHKNFDRALVELDKLIIYEPDNINWYVQKAGILSEINNHKKAIEIYQDAYKLNPRHPFLLGDLIHARTKVCDWKNITEDIKKLEEEILSENKSSAPYTVSTLFDSSKLLLQSAKIWQAQFLSKNKRNENSKKLNKRKIKLGFYSADFRNHAMGHLMVQMFELHDKSEFELHGFYFGPSIDEKDLIQKRIINCFDSFNDISKYNDERVFELSKKINIDIAIDLMCHTGNRNRFGIFQKKMAPIQINFLGYPGTSGSKYFDYIVADKVIIPKESQKYYTEKIIYLPDTYQANENTKKISDKKFTKQMFGLPEDKFIFCSFNSNHKINASIFNLWLKILMDNKNSVLWILCDNEQSKENLKNFTIDNNVDPKRLIFAKYMPLAEHLKRLDLADVLLDTFPYNAHTSCSDALRVNLPVITLRGETFASRVAASLLTSINVTELITDNKDDYHKLASKICNDPKYFNEIKSKVMKNKSSSNLFKCEVYTKNIEKAYNIAFKNFVKGETLENIEL